jgi:enoyl-CoA hydratase/carnithine racemase
MSEEATGESANTSDRLILTEDHEGVRVFTINRPALLNAWDRSVTPEFLDALRAADSDPGVRCCVVTGKGDKAFCAGANLKDPNSHVTTSIDDELIAMRTLDDPIWLKKVITFRKPLIAAVNGYAIGAGFFLALCCDIIIASENAEFRMPQAALGILPTFGATARLAQWVGRGRAMNIALTGRAVSAEEAERIGLVSTVVSQSELMPSSLALAARLAAMPQLGVALTKESLTSAMESGALDFTSVADMYRYIALTLTEDTKSQHQGWRERR